MNYLYVPTAAEELIVRGRYEFVGQNGVVQATEKWERYRNEGSPIQTWRSELKGQQDGVSFKLLAHSVVSPDGVERLKLRFYGTTGTQQNLTLTFMPDSIFVHDNQKFKYIALPSYGLVTPQPSLARFAFPFDLGSHQPQVATRLLLRLLPDAERLAYDATKFTYTPLALQSFTIKNQVIRVKGWRIEGSGLPTQEAWFDRNGTCLLWQVQDGMASWRAELVDWIKFG